MRKRFFINHLFPGLTCLFITTFAVFSCNNKPKNNTGDKKDHFDCTTLANKKVIYPIAISITGKHDNDQIWNLYEIDTTEFFTTEDYFINTKTKNRLVLVGGSAGLSSGTADNLLILFSCADTFNVVWAGQVSDFGQKDIIDVNGDGIKEIVENTSMMWMGECGDNYRIFNFKDGKQNAVYSAYTMSVIDCGKENLGELYKRGDTLENRYDCELVKLNDKEYTVRQIQTIRIHNGGNTDEEIIKKLKVSNDTTMIKLR